MANNVTAVQRPTRKPYLKPRPYALKFYTDTPEHYTIVTGTACRHLDLYRADGFGVVWEEEANGEVRDLSFVLDSGKWKDRYTFAQSLKTPRLECEVVFGDVQSLY